MKSEWGIPMRRVAQLIFSILREIPVLGHHSIQVAKISALMAKKMDLSPEKVMTVFLLGGLHDIGLIAPKLRKREIFGVFEKSGSSPEIIVDIMKDDALFKDHGPIGARIISMIPPLSDYSLVIHHHHTPAAELDINFLTVLANLVMMADAISLRLMLRGDIPDREFAEDVIAYINTNKSLFFPDIREIAKDTISEEGYMMLASDDYLHWDEFVGIEVGVDSTTFASILAVLDFLVDSKVDETKHHSTRVAFLSRDLAREMLSDSESFGLFIAGRLHDIGKIFIPSEVLKRSRKNSKEDFVYRTHVIHTYKLLSRLEAFQSITAWAVSHHERLDGSGYPWKLKTKDMSIPARILQVADVYVSTFERGGDPLRTVEEMAGDGKLDKSVVQVLKNLVHGGYDVSDIYDFMEMYMEEVEG